MSYKNKIMENINIFEVLEDNGFTKVVTKLSKYDKFKNLFRKKRNKKKTKVHNDWLEKNIDGKKYEIFCYDMHTIYVRINGEIVLAEDDRKIDDRFVLLFIPGFMVHREFDVQEFTYWYNEIYKGYKSFLRLDKLSSGYIGEYCEHIGIEFDYKYYNDVYSYWKELKNKNK